jgi:hypothetical protein
MLYCGCGPVTSLQRPVSGFCRCATKPGMGHLPTLAVGQTQRRSSGWCRQTGPGRGATASGSNSARSPMPGLCKFFQSTFDRGGIQRAVSTLRPSATRTDGDRTPAAMEPGALDTRRVFTHVIRRGSLLLFNVWTNKNEQKTPPWRRQGANSLPERTPAGIGKTGLQPVRGKMRPAPRSYCPLKFLDSPLNR